ncbi:Tubulin polyglutamylase complex subunit [Operophtera brumata]|uniref:Tubulin polyglutamylase complex subunit n=1 Tax=Operophtera brumata TaxID=104452 RepID=A0A0L7KU64_OPEBR|nr:Tubulin polyglutamylase complex subunit [Operophtera brumata]
MTRQATGPRPELNTKSKVLELDTCRTIVWLATREGAWGWLADSFTHYFRMALVHLGLPGWQAAFANLPPIPWAEKTEAESGAGTVANETGFNHIDPHIFKISVRHHKNKSRVAAD